MTPADAAALIEHDIPQQKPLIWADLGAGQGTFTLALAQWLPPGSLIYAIDTDSAALATLPDRHGNVAILKHAADFVNDTLPFSAVDGFLLANSLHYVRDKSIVLEKLQRYLSPGGNLLVVEYNTDQPNPPWVPYPVSFSSLARLFDPTGWLPARHLQERPSIYGRAALYAALLTRRNASVA